MAQEDSIRTTETGPTAAEGDDLASLAESDLSLLETLDHVLDSGLVIAGEITIAVADIDLIFVGLNVLLGSVETIEQTLKSRDR